MTEPLCNSFTISVGKQVSTDLRNQELGEDPQLELKSELSRFRKRHRKRRSYMETDYTSLVSFPEEDPSDIHDLIHPDPLRLKDPDGCLVSQFDDCLSLSDQVSCPTVSSLTNAESEPAQLESKPITLFKSNGFASLQNKGISKASQRKQQVMLMEPDSMEFKSVTELMSAASPTIVAVRTSTEPKVKGSSYNSNDLVEDKDSGGGLDQSLLGDHLFFSTSKWNNEDSVLAGEETTQSLLEDPDQENNSIHPASDSASEVHLPSLPGLFFSQSVDIVRLNNDEGCMDSETQIFLKEKTRSHSTSAISETTDLIADKTTNPKQTPDPPNPKLSPPTNVGQTPGYLFAQCSSGIIGPLSASTLRGKIQRLPLYLSRSQEIYPCSRSDTNDGKLRSSSETLLHDVEVAEIATEDMHFAQTEEVNVCTLVSEEVMEVIVQDEPHVNGIHGIKTDSQEELQSSTCQESLFPVRTNLSSVVVTTQNLNGPWSVITTADTGGLHGECSLPVNADSQVLNSCFDGFLTGEFKPTMAQPQALSASDSYQNSNLSCGTALNTVCESIIEGAQTPIEVCGCQAVYANCFNGVLDSNNFDDELTVYEFSCRTQPGECDRVALMTSLPPSSLSGSSSSFSPSSPLPSFPRLVLPTLSSSELGPLLSPLETPDCFLLDPRVNAVNALLAQHYPLPPTGFVALQKDVNALLEVLTDAVKYQDSVQKHARDTCADHFSENKRKLHVEARGFLAGCQQVVKTGQTPAETLQALAKSFHLLVQLALVCISFSSCQRCQERHSQAILGLSDVAQTYQEFARAAERLGTAAEMRACHELCVKLLARQYTALTTSVFCLTQLFRTLTAL